jgi:hypothetical protein
VVKREASDGDIETCDFDEILDPAAAEDPTVRGFRIDGDNVIAGSVKCSRKPTVSASDFQDASRRAWQL